MKLGEGGNGMQRRGEPLCVIFFSFLKMMMMMMFLFLFFFFFLKITDYWWAFSLWIHISHQRDRETETDWGNGMFSFMSSVQPLEIYFSRPSSSPLPFPSYFQRHFLEIREMREIRVGSSCLFLSLHGCHYHHWITHILSVYRHIQKENRD